MGFCISSLLNSIFTIGYGFEASSYQTVDITINVFDADGGICFGCLLRLLECLFGLDNLLGNAQDEDQDKRGHRANAKAANHPRSCIPNLTNHQLVFLNGETERYNNENRAKTHSFFFRSS